MASTTRDVPTDALLKALADRQRRTVLRLLRQNGTDPVAVDELVDALSPPDEAARDDQSQDVRRRLRVKLQHVHLPRLAEVEALEYDSRAATVRYTAAGHVENVLDCITTELD